MLIIKAYMTETPTKLKEIDEIRIQNIGFTSQGISIYSIEKPKMHDEIVFHDRAYNWTILAEKVLARINAEKGQEVNWTLARKVCEQLIDELTDKP